MKKQFYKTLKDAIGFYGKHDELDFLSLPLDEQMVIAKAYIEYIDRDVWHCFDQTLTGMIDNDFLTAMVTMMQKPTCAIAKEEFANATARMLIAYYADKIQEHIDNVSADLKAGF